MNEQLDMDAIRHKLTFLYRKISMSPNCMACWMESDLFVSMVWDEIVKGTYITDKVLCDIIHRAYDEISSNRSEHPNFKIQTARRGMHQLERACET